MEGMGGMEGMMGLLPMVVGAGVVMKVTDSMLGSQQQPQRQSRRTTTNRSKKMAKNKINGSTKGLNKKLFAQGQGIGASARKTAKKIGSMSNPYKLSGTNSDPSKTSIFKAVQKAGKKSKSGIY